MDIQNYKDQPEFKESASAANHSQMIDSANPSKMAIDSDASLATIVQSFIALQSQTNHSLIEYISKTVATEAGNVDINEEILDKDKQRVFLTEIATKQNLMSRQLERSLHQQISGHQGLHLQADLHLINPPPDTWGNADKVSDSSLKLIPEFSGDSSNNENDLTQFLRSIFALAKTSDLSQQTTLNVILRKLTGSAFILADKYVQDKKEETLSVAQMIRLLESKFLASCSPLSAESQLHALKQGSLTYAQLQAKCTRLATLATRMEKADTRNELRKIKEVSSYLMALSNSDRVCIHNENARRNTHNLGNFSLDQMADHLQALAAEKISYIKEPVLLTQEELTNRHVDNVQEMNQRRGGANPNRDRNFVRNSQPQLGNGQFNSKFRGRGGYKQTNQRDHYKQTDRKYDRPFVTHNMVNVEKNACLLCGDYNHTFKQQKCPYFNNTLMASPCKFCNRGGHPHSQCKQRQQEGPPNRRHF